MIRLEPNPVNDLLHNVTKNTHIKEKLQIGQEKKLSGENYVIRTTVTTTKDSVPKKIA